jgi:hypothetical protein
MNTPDSRATLSPETRARIERTFELWEQGDPETIARIEKILKRPHPELDAMQRAIARSEQLTERDYQLRMTC